MRIVNRAHLPWFAFVVVATLFATWLYFGNFRPQSVPVGLQLPHSFVQRSSDHRSVGGTPLGLIFGTISLTIFVFAALLGVRKKLVLWRVGTVQRWLRAHIWLTLLTIPLVLFHSGFRLGGPMTALLIILYLIVMVSGIYGLILQHYLPTAMMERLPAESVYQQVPHIRAQLVAAAQTMRGSFSLAADTSTAIETAVAPTDADSETALVDFLDRQVLPYLSAHRGEKFLLGKPRVSEDTFRFVKLRVTEAYRDRVEEMQGWCNERRMLDLQTRLQHWLHGWLFVHAPISFLLLMLTFWHAFVTLFYY